MQIVVAIVLLFVIYGILNVYIGWHGLLLFEFVVSFRSTSDLSPIFELIYWLLFSLIALSYLLTRLPFIRGRVHHVLQWLGAWYIAVFYYSLLLLPLLNGSYYLLVNSSLTSTAMAFMICTSCYLFILSILFIRGSWNARHPIVREYRVHIDGKPAASVVGEHIRSLRIAVASDLHLGHLVNKNHLHKLLQLVRERKPDVLLLPGDVVDDDPEAFVSTGMADVMREIVETTRLGVFAVLGNHEYYGRQISNYVEIMKNVEVRVLCDEWVLLDDELFGTFYIIGRKDFTAEQMSSDNRLAVSELVASLDRSLPLIMMDHQPRRFDLALQAGIDLLFCGHTHRGQFAPNHWITRRIFELDWGFLRKNSLHVIVSSGFGTWGPPMRIASRSELLLVTVTRD